MSVRAAILGDFRSSQVVAAVLIDVLRSQDCDDQLPCPITVLTSLTVLLRDASPAGVHTLRRQHPTVIRACLDFLLKPRDPREIDALASLPHLDLVPCPCVLESPNSVLSQLHRTTELGFDFETYLAGFSALQTLLMALLLHTRGVACEVFHAHSARALIREAHRASLCGQQPPWPSGQLDIFPYVIEASIAALCAWTRVLPECFILDLAAALCRSFGLHIFPRILVRVIIPCAIIPIFRCLLDEDAPQNSTFRNLDEVKISVQTLTSAYRPMCILLAMDDRQLRAAIGDTHDHMAELLRLVISAQKRITALGAHVKETYMRRIFPIVAARLHSTLGLPIPRGVVFSSGEWDATLVEEATNIYCHLASFMDYFGSRCGRIGCMETPLSLCRKLGVCAGCHHVSYCSKACQKAAWKSKEVPHKRICGPLRTIMIKVYCAHGEGLGSLARSEFRELCEKTGVEYEMTVKVTKDLLVLYGE